MKARSQIIKHPLGVSIKTPLLVPSFSSKGFTIKNGKSNVSAPLLLSRGFLEECMLVSAFDIYHSLIPEPDKFAYCTETVILDSGGYESSSIYDFSGIIEYDGDSEKINEWNIEKLESVIENWSERYPAIIVNFDHGNIRKSLNEQISEANSFFHKYPKTLNIFLIKPETSKQPMIQINNILESIHLFDQFDIIGLAEKELGDSMLMRMRNIYKIRKRMDEMKNSNPIHVFGSLDPVSSVLYFLAGAEIFDGLTWLRFSYFNNSAIYINNFSVFYNEFGIAKTDTQIKIDSIINNIRFLTKMKYAMINFIKTGKFVEFDISRNHIFGKVIEQNYKTFLNSLKE